MKLDIMELNTVVVPIVLTANTEVPVYATPGSAGFDLVLTEDTVIPSRCTVKLPTGLRFAVPMGYEVQIRPRSGLSLSSDLWIRNTPGTIDSDFRGELMVLMYNAGDTGTKLYRGVKMAQGVLCPVVQAQFEVVDSLDTTERGSNGFGSTGV